MELTGFLLSVIEWRLTCTLHYLFQCQWQGQDSRCLSAFEFEVRLRVTIIHCTFFCEYFTYTNITGLYWQSLVARFLLIAFLILCTIKLGEVWRGGSECELEKEREVLFMNFRGYIPSSDLKL